MNCYFPMPFNKRAKIEVINENERPLGLFFHIDYELYHEETPDIAYFQAAWRRDMPCSGWGNDLCVNSPEVNSVPNFDGKENFLMWIQKAVVIMLVVIFLCFISRAAGGAKAMT